MHKFVWIIAFSLLANKSQACICWFPTDKKVVKSMIKEADAVLQVVIVPDTVNTNYRQDSSLHVTQTTFKIEKAWKGPLSVSARFTAKSSPCSDADYIAGERYLIFGYFNPSSGLWETNECSSISDKSKQRSQIERQYVKDGDMDKCKKALADVPVNFQMVTQWLDKYARR